MPRYRHDSPGSATPRQTRELREMEDDDDAWHSRGMHTDAGYNEEGGGEGEGDVEGEGVWEVKEILAENSRKKTYKIAWEGINPETGREWSPTWEPYECVSQVLIDEWEAAKVANSTQQRRLTKQTLMNKSIAKQYHSRSVSPADDYDDAYNSSAQAKRKRKPSPSEDEDWFSEPRSPTPVSPVNDISGDYFPPGSGHRRQQQRQSKRRGGGSITSGKRKRESRGGYDDSEEEEESPDRSQRNGRRRQRKRREGYDDDDDDDSGGRSDIGDGRTSSSRHADNNSRRRLFSNQRDSSPVDDLSPRTGQSQRRRVSRHRQHRRDSVSPDYALPVSDSEQQSPRRRSAGRRKSRSHRDAGATSPRRTSTPDIEESAYSRRYHNRDQEHEYEYEEDADIMTLPPPLRSRFKPDYQSSTPNRRRVLASVEVPMRQRNEPSSGRSATSLQRGKGAMAPGDLPSFKKAPSRPDREQGSGEYLFQLGKPRYIDGDGWPTAINQDISGEGQQQQDALEAGDDLTNEPNEFDEWADEPGQSGSVNIVPDSQPVRGGTAPAEEDADLPMGMDARGRSLRRPAPLAPVKAPDPRVFRPFLQHDEQEDDIQQFSSQPAPNQPQHAASKRASRVVEIPSSSVFGGSTQQGQPAAETATTGRTAIDISLSQPVANLEHDNDNLGDLHIPSETPRAANSSEAVSDSLTSTEQSSKSSVAIPTPAAEQTTNDQPKQEDAKPTYEVQKVSTNTPQALRLISQSDIVEGDMKQELTIFLEATAYYIASGRLLTTQSDWELLLEKLPDGATWVMLINMASQDWSLEKRVPSSGRMESLDALRALIDGNNDSSSKILTHFQTLLDNHNTLQQSYDRLKLSNERSLLRIATLETDVDYARKQYLEAAARGEVYVQQNKVLQAQVAELTRSVEVGLEQTRMIGKAKEDRLQSEVEKMTKELAMAKEMAMRTNDVELRAKAARAEELEGREAERAKNTIYWPAVNALATSMAEQQNAASGGHFQQVTLMADESSEDEDFEAGSSGSDGDSYTSSEGEEVPGHGQPAVVPSQPADGPFSRGPSLSNNMLIPPASFDGSGNPADSSAFDVSHGPVPGETTMHTSVDRIHDTSDPSSTSATDASAKKSTIESEELLELDSMTCDSQYAYYCEWGRTRGTECRAALDSQKDLYEHMLTHVGQ